MISERGLLSGASIAHTDASLDQLEAVTDAGQRETVTALLDEPGVREAFVLQTCNRVEAYVVTDEAGEGRAALSQFASDVPADVVTEMGHEESLRHLLRVAAGLESLVLGEDQILGQVHDAYEDADEAGGIGPILDDAVTKAIHVGERARTETAINEGVVSLASAAVKLVSEKHGLDGASAAVVGVGEMGTLAAKRLAGQVDDLLLANRTVERAEALAASIDPRDTSVRATDLDDLAGALAPHDVVVSATGSPEWILAPEACSRLDETFIVDITRPRDVPPVADDEPQLTVYDLDDLESVTEKTRKRRREAARRVERIVDEEFERLLVQYKRGRADSVISAMYESAERIKADELATTFEKLDLDEEERATVEALADAIVSQLLAPPTNSLRDAAEQDDWTTIHTALQLFDPDFEASEPPDFVAEMDLEEVPEEVRDQLPVSGDEDE
ncbi:glutamyl-tRNA reductase [Halobacteriales archaeon QH_2_65_14]|nr:MAG: glutamyl-tRNA reductase [Halobacteriales archaeon QH_2_65_14]